MMLLSCFFILCFIRSLLDGQEHPCVRNCSNSKPMTCYYNWTLELYRSMSKACYECPFNLTDCRRLDCIAGDGLGRLLPTVNRLMPGPSIQICLNDTIIVDAQNNIDGMVTTLHWHGIRQTETPYMDGVPWVTQCPINTFETFRYEFTPEESGTYWWHSHIVCQRDAIFGSLIIQLPKKLDPHENLYDFDLPEHVMIIQTWHRSSCIEDYNQFGHASSESPNSTILINGKGRNMAFERDGRIFFTPLSRFLVREGFRYRFRVISNVILNCPVEITVDKHLLIMVSSDGNDFEPVSVSSFVINSGERWDFILEANQPPGLYWMKVRGLSFCDSSARAIQTNQTAVLQYMGESDVDIPEDAVIWENPEGGGKQLNPVNVDATDNSTIALIELIAMAEDDDTLKETPDVQLYILSDLYSIDNNHFHVPGIYGFFQVEPTKRIATPQLDHISMMFPPSPLLSQRDDFFEEDFCNPSTLSNRNCTKEFCECTHIKELPLDAVIELIVVDEGNFPNANHPFHLHGTTFRVIAMGKVGSNLTVDSVKKLDVEGKIIRLFSKAPLKDTVAVIGGGYTILRFKSSNPGYWLFHCHIEVHMEHGMSFVFKVGDNDHMLPVPEDFPKCGNYIPKDSRIPLNT